MSEFRPRSAQAEHQAQAKTAVNLLAKQRQYIELELGGPPEADHYQDVFYKLQAAVPLEGSSLRDQAASRWYDFHVLNDVIRDIVSDHPNQPEVVGDIAAKSLIHIARMSADLVDRVGLGLSLRRDLGLSSGHRLNAIGLVANTAAIEINQQGHLNYQEPLEHWQSFEQTPMGRDIIQMHSILDGVNQDQAGQLSVSDKFVANRLVVHATRASVHSLRAWQTHIQYLKQVGICPNMPRPAVPNLEVIGWKSQAANLKEAFES